MPSSERSKDRVSLMFVVLGEGRLTTMRTPVTQGVSHAVAQLSRQYDRERVSYTREEILAELAGKAQRHYEGGHRRSGADQCAPL